MGNYYKNSDVGAYISYDAKKSEQEKLKAVSYYDLSNGEFWCPNSFRLRQGDHDSILKVGSCFVFNTLFEDNKFPNIKTFIIDGHRKFHKAYISTFYDMMRGFLLQSREPEAESFIFHMLNPPNDLYTNVGSGENHDEIKFDEQFLRIR